MRRGPAILLTIGLGFVLVGSGEVVRILAESPLRSFSLASPLAFIAMVGCTSTAGGIFLYRNLRRWSDSSRLQRNLRKTSDFAGEWIPMLHGDYTPYVVEAAQRLGDARETTAVPALMYVLEQAVNTQPPGWCDRAEALAVALGKMGDRRALPLLYRLTNWRGIGLLTAVHEAIDRLEPQTSLLRPGSADDLPTETLLRPADRGPESDSTLLLRSGQAPESLSS